MISPEKVALVLLAAGHSSRFSGGHKLEQALGGQSVIDRLLTAIGPISFGARIAVVHDRTFNLGLRGFQLVRNEQPDQGLSSSLRLGIEAASATTCAAALILLADMPNIDAAYLERLLGAFEGADTIIASSDGFRRTPPALFGRDMFGALCALEGDQGARTLLAQGRAVEAEPAALIDIDTREDLESLRQILES